MFKPIPTACWQRFLLYKGFKERRISSSHHQWTKPGHRTIAVWGNEKEIPAFHLKTSCKSIGITTDELYAWVKENC